MTDHPITRRTVLTGALTTTGALLMGINPTVAMSPIDRLAHRLRKIENDIRSLQTAQRLRHSSIGEGGIRFHGGGSATFHQGGGVKILDGGDVEVSGADAKIRALDSAGEKVFEVNSEPASIFMDPALIAELSAQALNFRIESAFDDTDGTLNDTDLLFHDLDTGGTGPAVTVPVSATGVAIVTVGARMDWQDLSGAVSIVGGGVGFAVSGATTRAPDVDEEYGYASSMLANGSAQIKGVNEITVTGLNPGNNTFTLKYRNRDLDRFTTFGARSIKVIGL